MTEHVLVEKAEKILILTLSRPEKKNALTRAMYQTLATQIASADTDPEVHCILIMAQGDMFTAGNDLADFAAIGSAASAPKPEDGNPPPDRHGANLRSRTTSQKKNGVPIKLVSTPSFISPPT